MDKSVLRSLESHPLVPERWGDLETLFGEHGATGGCWCMWWRQTRAEFNSQHGEPNRIALRTIVESGVVPGIMAYSVDEPVGWCAVEPRESYPALDRSRTLARVDCEPVWSTPCFYIARHFRGKGLMLELLTAAVNWAAEHGARIIEAYPVEPGDKSPGTALYTGVVPIFQRAGFVEVCRRSKRQPIMRKAVGR
jgi:GNAT superfamily N-acetyltransferase